MWILTIFLAVLFIAAAYVGNRPWFTLDRLTRDNVLNGALAVLILFTLLMVAYITGFFPQSVAAPFMMMVYITIAGFFTGYAFRLIRFRSDAGDILYQHRTFWVDHAPNLFAVILIIYGIYRTAILTDIPVTGIRITSGVSLICFGIFTWTLKTVPEFRSNGIILLDRFIPWKEVLSWNWQSEDVVAIEYISPKKHHDERIRQFATSIPEDERKEVEMVLASKLEEFDEERKKVLFGDDD
jgi:hypothetical protein